jgi:hypothetical protein
VNARLAVGAGNFLSNRCSVKKTLHIRQEGDEFLVAPFLDLRRFRAEVIDDPAPLIAGLDFLQGSPVPLHLFARPERHELNGPDDDLAEMPDARPASARVWSLLLRRVDCLRPTHHVPLQEL